MTAAIAWKLVTSRLAGPVGLGLAAVLLALWMGALLSGASDAAAKRRLAGELEAAEALAARHEAAARGWRRSFEAAEGLRAEERKSAVRAVAAAASSCAVRIAEARRSATAIHSIVTEETTHDPKGCPDRRLVPAERLRDALAPAH